MILTLVIFPGIQSVFGQQKAENKNPEPIVTTQNYCFRIIEPGRGGCPVGENIPYGTPLLEAMRNRDVPKIKRLISEGANVNEADDKGRLPLLLAAGGDLELIDILLEANADANIEGLYGATPLAASTICSQAVEKILKAGADVNRQNNNKQTALMSAAENRNIESVKLLLDANADISVKDLGEMTALLHAVKSGSLEITKFLYEKGGKKDFSDDSAAAIALSYAASNAQPEMMKFLLQAGINPNVKGKYGSTAITMAAMRKSVETVRLLIENGADVNLFSSQTQSPLEWAAQYGSTEIVKILIAARANVNPKGNWSPIINAARNNQVETMQILVKAGAALNTRGYEGKTALMDAACGLNVEAVEFLLQNGADVNLIDDGESAISLARKCGAPNNEKQNRIIRLLLNAGAIEQ